MGFALPLPKISKTNSNVNHLNNKGKSVYKGDLYL